MNFNQWLVLEEGAIRLAIDSLLSEMFDTDTAAALAEKAKGGDKGAESKFIMLISPMVERGVNRKMRNHEMSADVYNDVLMAVVNQTIRSAQPFDFQYLPATINRMIANKAIDAFRKTGNQDRQGRTKTGTVNVGDDGAEADQQKLGMPELAYTKKRGNPAISAMIMDALHQVMDEMDPVDQEIIQKYYFDQENGRNIAAAIINPKTGNPISAGSLHERIERIRLKMREKLTAMGVEAGDLDHLGSTFSYAKNVNSDPLKKQRGMQGNRGNTPPAA